LFWDPGAMRVIMAPDGTVPDHTAQ
jgi:hypothetical protein